jgi:hypothetical protein
MAQSKCQYELTGFTIKDELFLDHESLNEQSAPWSCLACPKSVGSLRAMHGRPTFRNNLIIP